MAAGYANATVLFAGGEDVDFTEGLGCVSTSCTTTTDASFFRPAWARAALSIQGVGTTRTWSGNFNAAASDIWVHFQDYANSDAAALNTEGVKLTDSTDSLTALLLRGTGTAGTVKISTKTNAGVYNDLLACSAGWPGDGTLEQFDMHIVYAVSGSVDIYRNGISFCSYSGDVTTNGRTALNGVAVSNINGAQSTHWSEMIVADEDTRAMNLWTIPPLSAGTLTQFTPSNGCSTVWNVTTFNDSSTVSASSANLIQECTVTATLPSGSYEALAYKIAARAAVGVTGPQHFDAVTHIAGTDYLSGDIAPNGVENNYSTYQATNPASGLSWVPSDFTDPGFQFGMKSTP